MFVNLGCLEEVIVVYEKVLLINFNFVRVRYNLGVFCINIGCYVEVVGYLFVLLDMYKFVEKSGREKVRELFGGGGGLDMDVRIDVMII